MGEIVCWLFEPITKQLFKKLAHEPWTQRYSSDTIDNYKLIWILPS